MSRVSSCLCGWRTRTICLWWLLPYWTYCWHTFSPILVQPSTFVWLEDFEECSMCLTNRLACWHKMPASKWDTRVDAWIRGLMAAHTMRRRGRRTISGLAFAAVSITHRLRRRRYGRYCANCAGCLWELIFSFTTKLAAEYFRSPWMTQRRKADLRAFLSAKYYVHFERCVTTTCGWERCNAGSRKKSCL